MPLPNDETLLKLSEETLSQFAELFGKHPGLRPVHPKGVLLSGTFKPTPEAANISTAPHFNNPSTPITVRFSNSTGIPEIPDTDPNANPRGFAIRFNLGHRVHTDIIAHAAPGFPTRTGEDFLEFIKAVAASPPGSSSPTAVEKFLESHPAALAFSQLPKPFPTSLATQDYFGVHAFKFTNAEGVSTFGRYIITPDAGISHLDEEKELKSKSSTYLFDELPERIAKGGPFSFTLHIQIPKDGDVIDDSTVQWPKDRPVIELGKLTLDAVLPNNDAEQKYIIFDPIPRVQGVEPSDDPLLEFRAAVYLISGRRRRAA